MGCLDVTSALNVCTDRFGGPPALRGWAIRELTDEKLTVGASRLELVWGGVRRAAGAGASVIRRFLEGHVLEVTGRGAAWVLRQTLEVLSHNSCLCTQTTTSLSPPNEDGESRNRVELLPPRPYSVAGSLGV